GHDGPRRAGRRDPGVSQRPGLERCGGRGLDLDVDPSRWVHRRNHPVMTVALVYPPLWDSVDSPPLGPAVLAGALRQAGAAVQFVDLNLAFHDWLFADQTLAGLMAHARARELRDEVVGLERLLEVPAAMRVARPERTAPLMALAC